MHNPAPKTYTDYLLKAMQELEDLGMDLSGTTRLLAIESDYKEVVEKALQNDEQLFITDTMVAISDDAHVQLAFQLQQELYKRLNDLSDIYHNMPDGLAHQN